MKKGKTLVNFGMIALLASAIFWSAVDVLGQTKDGGNGIYLDFYFGAVLLVLAILCFFTRKWLT